MLDRAKRRAKADKEGHQKPKGGITYPEGFIDDLYPDWRRNERNLPGDWMDHDPRLINDLWWWHSWHEWADEQVKSKKPPTQAAMEPTRGIEDL